MSGGTEGGMAPHWTVFERGEGTESRDRRLRSAAHTRRRLPAGDLGRTGQVEAVAAGVRAAMADAGIERSG